MPLTSAQARRLIMSLPKAAASPHMDREAFRAGRRIFATLRSSDGTLNVMLSPDMQAVMCEDSPEVFQPVAGAWGPLGWTQINLAAGAEADILSALNAAVEESLVNRRKKPR
jgi:YjbR